jgi:3-dehydroquinate synthase
MQEHNFGSSSCVLALGGGVITDMAGFVAATYHRGIKAVYVPTTLLAMTDAAIGGKTGINTAYGKNKIGTITAPDSIWLDPLLLNTLSQSQWDDGWAEIKKHAIISGEAQVYQIKHSYSKYLRQSLSTAELTEIITNSCKIKNDIVTKDPLELGARRLLNFGHTIAHGLESYFSYQISHGLAVLIGCVTEAYLAKSYFGMSKTTFIKIKELCSQNNQLLPYKINTTEFIAILRRDKKNNNNDIYCSLMLGLGVCYNQSDFIAAVNKEQITVAIEYLNNNYTTF